MASDDLRWPRMASDGLGWPLMTSDGLGWPRMALNGRPMLTGALHDICPPGARLVGKRTYGKGLIQGYVDCIGMRLL